MKSKYFFLLLISLFCFCSYDIEDSRSLDNGSDTGHCGDCAASQRTGAICKDGTTSDATGAGACSKHGGVDCWTCR